MPRGTRAHRPRHVLKVRAGLTHAVLTSQTPRQGCGTAAHGGGTTATRGRARACDVAPAHFRSVSVACAPVPLHNSPKIANKLQNL
jgi:hypothetical protein